MRRIEMSELERKALAKAGADCVKSNNEDKKMISMDKQYLTRDGREVRIYAVDTGPNQLIHGAHCEYKIWRQHSWDKDGKDYFGNSSLNLIEVKPRIQKEMWLNIYGGKQGMTAAFDTKVDCDNLAAPNRIACVKITIDCEEGEGL